MLRSSNLRPVNSNLFKPKIFITFLFKLTAPIQAAQFGFNFLHFYMSELYKEIPTYLPPEARLRKLVDACLKVNTLKIHFCAWFLTADLGLHRSFPRSNYIARPYCV